MAIPGVDYAWSHPGGAALKAAGKKFACRYSSTDPKKDLTRAEADDLAAHGVSSVIVRESTANRAGQGKAAGIADAKAAVVTAVACGMPSTRPLYFAVDYNANPATVAPYFQGVASVIGLSRVGVYGGFKVVKYLLDHGYAKWAWQTRAWSANQWDTRAHIRQLAYITINGVQCDDNQAYAADYGQWTPGKSPLVEDDMPAPDVWNYKIPVGPDKGAATLPAAVLLRGTSADVKYLNAMVHQLLTQQAATTATIKTLVGLVGSNADATQIITAIQDAIKNTVIRVEIGTDQPAAG